MQGVLETERRVQFQVYKLCLAHVGRAGVCTCSSRHGSHAICSSIIIGICEDDFQNLREAAGRQDEQRGEVIVVNTFQNLLCTCTMCWSLQHVQQQT